jgi:hypothetical protein
VLAALDDAGGSGDSGHAGGAARWLIRAVGDPLLEVARDSVLVLAGCGPVGAGMPEWGNIPIPAKLLREGVTDVVRPGCLRGGTRFCPRSMTSGGDRCWTGCM